MEPLHIIFQRFGGKSHFDLEPGEGQVKINDVAYKILANEEEMPFIKELVGRVGPVSSLEEFQEKINEQVWKERDKLGWLAQCCCHEKERDFSGLKEFLGVDDEFDEALESPEEMKKIFEGAKLTAFEVWDIFNQNGLPYPLGEVKSEPYAITSKDLQCLRSYLDDVGFRGVVALSDQNQTHIVTPTGQEKFAEVSFPIHSIGKVFTGALALDLPEDVLNAPIDLDLGVLPEAEHQHILEKRPTLFQAMTHCGGFGDYLGNYEKAVQEGKAPEMSKPEDFLRFADGKFYDEQHYSNTGILLVALAIQKYYGRPFDELLAEQDIADISMKKPENGHFNAEDPSHGEVMASPAGGQWATAAELQKLGKFLQKRCEDPAFLRLMETYGREFYVVEDREVHHNGCSTSGSSMLSSFLDSGVTIVVLSEQSNFMGNKIYHAIRENLLES